MGLPAASAVVHSVDVADEASGAAAAQLVAPPAGTSPPRTAIAAAERAAAAQLAAQDEAAAQASPPPADALRELQAARKARHEAIEARSRELQAQAKARRSKELLARHRGAASPLRASVAELAERGQAANAEAEASPARKPARRQGVSAIGETPRSERSPLTKNPRKLGYWRTQCSLTAHALGDVNRSARSQQLERLNVPRQVFQLCADICDGSDALAGALNWIHKVHGPAAVLEVEAAGLFRERGKVQRDDWSCPRARRKVALLTILLMAPHALPRSMVTGSTSDETLLVTAGVPQTLLIKLLHSSQREPYCTRTLQRDLAEIDLCTDLLLRWRTPVAHAQPWERRGAEHGVVNRYCVRANMVAEQWRRARDGAEALIKGTAIRLASWLVWRPAPARGSPVALERGGWLTAAARPPAPA